MKLNSYTWRGGVIKSDLPATTRHVLLTLSCHFNDAGEACYPSTSLLARETGLSERAVVTHLIRARELGWLIVSKHGFAGQKWSRNQYIPSFPEGTEARSVPSGKGAEPDAEKALNDVQSNYSVELLITTTTTAPQVQDCNCSSGLTQILHWPTCLPEDTRHLLLQGLLQLPENTQQQILDVVAAAHSAGTIKRTAEALAAGIIRRALRGGKDGFDPTPGLAIARRRAAGQGQEREKHADTSSPSRTTPEIARQQCKGIKALIKSRSAPNQIL